MTSTNTSASGRFGRAALTFAAFPIGGSAARLAVGALDAPAAALVGGLIAGAAIGLGQALGSSGRLPRARWTVATSLGMAAGLTAGAAAVDYDTSLGALATMGAITGAGVGAAQSVAWGATLPARARAGWAVLIPALWALGWTITTAIGVDVDLQWVVFGSAGAIVAAAAFGGALEVVAPAPATTEAEVAA